MAFVIKGYSIRYRTLFAVVLLLCELCWIAFSQEAADRPAGSSQVAVPSRIVTAVDETQLVTLTGNIYPLAREEFDSGAVSGEARLEKMVLLLKASAQQQAELDELVEAQGDVRSPLFRQWLTPREFGARFGVAVKDVSQVAGWLRGHGFQVDEVAASKRLIVFSGTAGQVADAFHTEIRRYRVNGAEHIANAQNPQIPAALTGVVSGVVSLHNFRRASEIASFGARPQYSSGSTHYLFPADFATIYDLNPLYSAGTTGTGATIAIVGRSNINLGDVAMFRTQSGIAANNPTVMLVGADPGLVTGDQDESTLDVEWSGTVAPEATVNFVVSKSTATTDGVDLAAQYAVNHATAQVLSMSYGSCEQSMGATELAFYNSLWQQAASQGMSVFVAAGDAGAAGCNLGSDTSGSRAAVNGLCSSTYSTCVGGTEFNEGASYAQYWSASNSSSYESALSYIPEVAWNESALDGGSGLWATGGGASIVYAQPGWQEGVSGVNGGMRTVPDVSMSAAGHDGYIIAENGSYWVVSGTSAASPSFAGVMALVVDAMGGAGQGNANAGLYLLASANENPFHATSSGNNSVPGVTGFAASGNAYNLATGLGSVDGAALVGAWVQAQKKLVPALTVTAEGTISVARGSKAIAGVTMAGTALSGGPVTLSVSGLPAGVTASWSRNPWTAGGQAGESTLTLTASRTAAAGLSTLTFNATGEGATASKTVVLQVLLAQTGRIGPPRAWQR